MAAPLLSTTPRVYKRGSYKKRQPLSMVTGELVPFYTGPEGPELKGYRGQFKPSRG